MVIRHDIKAHRTLPGFKASDGPSSVVDRHVAMRLRERRALLGMTQKHFAEVISTTHQQVSKYEAGRDRVAAGVLYRIAQALDVDVGYFFEGLGQTVDPSGRSRTWIALAQDVMRISNPRQRRALLRLALVMAGTDRRDDSDQGQDDS